MSSIQPNPSSQNHIRPRKKQVRWLTVILPIAIGLIVSFNLGPVLWQLLTSLKVNADISKVPNIYIPARYTLAHYSELFGRSQFLRYMFNSAFVAIISTALCLGLGSPAAYALARLRLRGEQIILSAVLIVTLFPYILLFLGLLEVVRIVGWGNNYLALVVPYTAINLPLTILVMRSFFQQLPKDLEDSAKVDGYSTLQMLVKILLPMTLPALVTTGIHLFLERIHLCPHLHDPRSTQNHSRRRCTIGRHLPVRHSLWPPRCRYYHWYPTADFASPIFPAPHRSRTDRWCRQRLKNSKLKTQNLKLSGPDGAIDEINLNLLESPLS